MSFAIILALTYVCKLFDKFNSFQHRVALVLGISILLLKHLRKIFSCLQTRPFNKSVANLMPLSQVQIRYSIPVFSLQRLCQFFDPIIV